MDGGIIIMIYAINYKLKDEWNHLIVSLDKNSMTDDQFITMVENIIENYSDYDEYELIELSTH